MKPTVLLLTGILGAMTLLHACLYSPPDPVGPPVTDPCVLGCANASALCSNIDKDNCSATCLDAVQKNISPWIFGYVGPNCWAAARSAAALEICPGRGPGTCL